MIVTNLEESNDSPPVLTSDTDLPEEGDDQEAGEGTNAPTVEEGDLVDVPSGEDED